MPGTGIFFMRLASDTLYFIARQLILHSAALFTQPICSLYYCTSGWLVVVWLCCSVGCARCEMRLATQLIVLLSEDLPDQRLAGQVLIRVGCNRLQKRNYRKYRKYRINITLKEKGKFDIN